MRRRFLLVAVLLLASLAGWFAYRSQSQLRQAWQQMYHQLGGGRAPDPAGVLDDPIFQTLPPPEKPVSLGRYTPPKPVASAPEPEPAPPPVTAPEPGPAEAAEPEPAAQPPAAPTPIPAAPRQKEVQVAAPVPEAKKPEPVAPKSAAPKPEVKAPSAVVPADEPAAQPPQPGPAPVQPTPEPELAPAAPAPPRRPAPAEAVPAPTPSPTSPPQAAAAPLKRPAPVAVTAKYRFIDRVASSHRLHVLVIGNDQDQLGQGRADVLMVLTFDPVGQKLTFLNIPRDTRVFLPGRGWVKINAGYAYGGPDLQTTMVERFLGIPMDRYVEISQGGFKAAIDAVGGVEVRPRFAFTVNDRYEFPLGPQRLDGTMALIYSTMRKQDPEGDLGRNRRQQEVLRSLLAEFGHLGPSDLGPLINGLLGELATTMRTDLTPTELLALRRYHGYLVSEQATARVEGRGGLIGRTWFYSVPDQERRRLHLLLRDQ